MNFPRKYQSIILRSAQTIAFSAAILCATVLALKLVTISNASTVAFIFLIIVLLSAFFGTILVAIITSVVAAVCFDYFFLPPAGTLNIAAFPDWISLAAFLMTSLIISRLTASAAENRVKAKNLDAALIQLKEFGLLLSSIPANDLTLSKLAEEILRVFSLEYCSIHVFGEGRWHHVAGAAAASNIFRKIENQINLRQDHKADLIEITDENMLGVQYAKINEAATHQALLVVKTNTLSATTVSAIASIVGIRIIEIMKNKKETG